MMSQGWIKLYRRLLDDAVCQKSTYFHVWVVLLLKAAHADREFIFNNQVRHLRPGQLITGRKKLSDLTGIPQTTIERILKCFESGRKIDQQKLKKFRIITVKNWDRFQSELSDGPDKGRQTDPTRTPGGQHTDTYKNEKNEKNEKKDKSASSFSSLSFEEQDIQRAAEANARALAAFMAGDNAEAKEALHR